jgi:hypothetical protein
MARNKVTSSDIYARLARGECANYRQTGCRGKDPCTIVVGEPCDYFNRYVKPLLDYPEFSAKYQREAKVTLAINPNAKVVRTRRTSSEPRLSLDAPPASHEATRPAKVAPAKAVPAAKKTIPAIVPAKPVLVEKPIPTPVIPPKVAPTPPAAPPAQPRQKPAVAPAAAPVLTLLTAEVAETPKKATPRAPKAPPAQKSDVSVPQPLPQLTLELTPTSMPARKAARRR